MEEPRFSAASRGNLSRASAPVAPLGLKADPRGHDNAALEGPLFHRPEKPADKMTSTWGQPLPAVRRSKAPHSCPLTALVELRSTRQPGAAVSSWSVVENHQLRLNSANSLPAFLKRPGRHL